eukprot:CAMPEP_0184019960 /NCGR_PEP_ID=MMETSP0954-20121128/9070_1 /TAXON_ID=627963 /ORGANISM="Aplanochytrium sp, Strain PBS07" /LENGTH=252 /DNA_ID=CAMNT_0026301741 /DNA_START=270 /DNA_END=1025 /DNA_ORIENTATION=-
MRLKPRTRRRPATNYSAIAGESEKPKTRTKKRRRSATSNLKGSKAKVKNAKSKVNGHHKGKGSRKQTGQGNPKDEASVLSPAPGSDVSSETETSRGSSSRKSIPVNFEKITRNGRTPFSFCFNLAYEPWIEYDLKLVADRGFREFEWTSSRLKTTVFYLETNHERFELKMNFQPEDIVHLSENHVEALNINELEVAAQHTDKKMSAFAKYTWSRVKSPEKLDDSKMSELGCPLPANFCESIQNDLDWNEFLW